MMIWDARAGYRCCRSSFHFSVRVFCKLLVVPFFFTLDHAGLNFSSVSSPSEQPLSSDGAGVGSDRALAFLLADDAVVADAGEVELTRVAIN